MNIFVLDKSPILCARYHCDKHCSKMILETAQLLSTALRLRGCTNRDIYKKTHTKHPCAIWAMESLENFLWLCQLGLALNKEFLHRGFVGKSTYGHKSIEVIYKSLDLVGNYNFPRGFTEWKLAMPDQYKTKNTVLSYRQYYIHEKSHLFKWTNRQTPYWIKDNNG